MTGQCSVSAVIPTRNRHELLRRAIGAMLGQEGDHLSEIIVVFDQSDPDDSLTAFSADVPIRVVANTHSPVSPGPGTRASKLPAVIG